MGTETPPAPLSMKEIVEAAGLADRPYLKEFLDKPADKDTVSALVKKLDGAETLIGKKRGIPESDDPKVWDDFLGKLRPEKADDYAFQVSEKADKDFLKAYREAAHGAGLSKVQMARFHEKIAPFFTERDRAAQEAAAARDAAYEAFVKEIAGGADFAKTQERVKTAVKELVPPEALQYVDKLDDKSLGLFVVFANAVLSKYAGEDEFKTGAGGTGDGAGNDATALTTEMNKLLTSDAWRDFRHPEHEKTKARFEEITKELGKRATT